MGGTPRLWSGDPLALALCSVGSGWDPGILSRMSRVCLSWAHQHALRPLWPPITLREDLERQLPESSCTVSREGKKGAQGHRAHLLWHPPPSLRWNRGTDPRGILTAHPPLQGPRPGPASHGPVSSSCPPPATTRCAQRAWPPPAALSPTPTPAWTAAGHLPLSRAPGLSALRAPPARTPAAAPPAAGSSSPSPALCEAGTLTASWMR